MRDLCVWIALSLGVTALGQGSLSASGPLASFSLSSDTICASQCINLDDHSSSPNGAIQTWNWDIQGGSQTWSVLQDPGAICFNTPGAYAITLTVTDNLGADDTTIFLVVSNDVFGYMELDSDYHVCEGDAIWVEAVSSQQPVIWMTGDTAQGIYYSPTEDGPLWAYFETPCGLVSDTTMVYVHEVPSIDAGDDIGFVLGQEVELDATVDGEGQITWGPPENFDCARCVDPTAQPFEDQVFTVTITNRWGCSATDSVRVYVTDVWEVDAPNIFSPNGDGLHDYFRVFGPPMAVFDMKVYNRWGEMMFQTSEIEPGWDGTFHGQRVNQGVYVYMVTGQTIDGRDVVKSGNVTLVR